MITDWYWIWEAQRSDLISKNSMEMHVIKNLDKNDIEFETKREHILWECEKEEANDKH